MESVSELLVVHKPHRDSRFAVRDSTERIMKNTLAAISLALFFAGTAAAQPPRPPAFEGPVILTTGEGSLKLAPDRVWVSDAA
jgi:hypothetical protein